jgi:hypothetical protein
MNPTAKFVSLLILIFIAMACYQDKLKNNCGFNIKTPSSDYGYPISVTPADTGFIYAKFKDSLDKRDSFSFAFYGYHFLNSFDELNLSLYPSGDVIVRISYDPSMDTPFVLKMSCNEIILKVYDSGLVYPPENLSKLNKKELLHYNILERFFPITNHNIPSTLKDYFDSLIIVNPELLSTTYYWSLKKKSITRDSLPMKYSIYKMPITKEKFIYFINRLNNANFWTLPSRMAYEPTPSDGHGYILEVHALNQFKLVTSSNCPEISIELTKVCQEIINQIAPKERNLILCNSE